nr:unnamed protein product [Digitaria exilis]
MHHHVYKQQMPRLGISVGAWVVRGVPRRPDDEINELLDHGAVRPGGPTMRSGEASQRSSTARAPPASSSSLNYAPRQRGGSRPHRLNPPRSRPGSAARRALCLAGSGGPRGSGSEGGGGWEAGGGGGTSEREQWPRASGMIRTLMKRR